MFTRLFFYSFYPRFGDNDDNFIEGISMTFAEFLLVIAFVVAVSRVMKPVQEKLEDYLTAFFSKKVKGGAVKSDRTRGEK
jgi:hypothetical protein